MNEAAACKTPHTPDGALKCNEKKKSWFSVTLMEVDDKGAESACGDVTLDLTIPDLGKVQRVTTGDGQAIKIDQLEPGGKGDVLQMTHATGVYEAIGDFS